MRALQSRLVAMPVCLALLGWATSSLAADEDEKRPIEFYVADQLSFDDNLFRVPDGMIESDPGAVTIQSVNDYPNRASAGMHARWDASRQLFGLDLRLDDVRYAENDNLNYVGGSAGLNWHWQAGKRWSGNFTGQYDRALASYSNYTFFSKDIVDVANYGVEVRLRIGSRWSLLGGAADTRTNHSADERQVEEFHGQTGRAGLEYRTPGDNLFAAEYRYTDAEFPNVDPLLTTFAHQYTERVPTLRMVYALTPLTRFEARYGYLDRQYNDVTAHDFAGGIWNAKLSWQPREKVGFEFAAWHDLRAYADSESEYFVARGVSFGPTWSPRARLKFTLNAAYEDEDYVNAGLLVTGALPLRKARVGSGNFGVEYWPKRKLSFRLQYRYLDYNSNRALEDYTDNVVSFQIRFAL